MHLQQGLLHTHLPPADAAPAAPPAGPAASVFMC